MEARPSSTLGPRQSSLCPGRATANCVAPLHTCHPPCPTFSIQPQHGHPGVQGASRHGVGLADGCQLPRHVNLLGAGPGMAQRRAIAPSMSSHNPAWIHRCPPPCCMASCFTVRDLQAMMCICSQGLPGRAGHQGSGQARKKAACSEGMPMGLHQRLHRRSCSGQCCLNDP